MEENGLTLLKQEMESCDEIDQKVKAVRRLKTVILSIGKDMIRS